MKKMHIVLALIALAGLVLFAFDATAAQHFLSHHEAIGGLLSANVAAAALPEAIQAELKKIGDDIRAQAEKVDKEIKRNGEMSAETRAKVDELLTTQGEVSARLATAEQLVAKLEQGGGGADRPKSMGEQFTDADGFEGFANQVHGQTKFKARINAAVTSDTASAGDAIAPMRLPGVNQSPERRLFLRDLLSWGRTSSNAVEYVKETGFTNNAAPVSENPASGKPESDIVLDMLSAPVATIAHYIRASKQVLGDVPMLQSYIDGRLRYGLKLKEEAQLLKGSGSGLNINGIYTQATAYSEPGGVFVQNETRIDRLRLAMLQAALAEYTADGIVLSPIDWANIELTKDADNAYIYANPRFLGAPSLWGLPVVATQSMDAGDFLVGAFQMGAQGWDREDVNVIVSLEDANNVTQNMVTILVEERLALTVFRPEAFVKGDFGGVNPSSGA